MGKRLNVNQAAEYTAIANPASAARYVGHGTLPDASKGTAPLKRLQDTALCLDDTCPNGFHGHLWTKLF